MVRCTAVGTASALPTAHRDNTALLFVGAHSSLLVDCPGGAYAKLQRAGALPLGPTHLLLTHRHTDHTHGLPGLLQSVWLAGREAELPLLGLPDVQQLVDGVLETFAPFGDRVPFALPRVPLPDAPGDAPILETPDFRVWTAPTDHSVASVAVRVEARESGAAVVYSSDTRPCATVQQLASGARLLIHEATFSHAEADEAARHTHTTATDAAAIARAADVASLWLVHFTPHGTVDEAAQRDEAVAVFGEAVEVPADFTSFEF